MKRNILLRGNPVEYDLQRKTVKNLNLRILPDQTVHVSANPRVPQEAIDRFLTEKADFILNALRRMEERARNTPQSEPYTDGSLVPVLGDGYLLRVRQGSSEHVEVDGNTVFLTIRHPEDATLRQRVMEKWLNTLCVRNVTALCEEAYAAFRPLGISMPRIRFRKMTSRWGSCQPVRSVLTFNTALAGQPPQFLRYVVYHEFTHFLQPDHSPAFYRKLSQFLPDWADCKRAMRKEE